jgi:serine/threonine-protein kinase RsbW
MNAVRDGDVRMALAGTKPARSDGNSRDLLDVRIDSDFAAGHALQEQILSRLTGLGFTPDSVFAVRLALHEALINAIKHGNRLDPVKKVHVKAVLTPARAHIIVEDEGPGFDRKIIPDPTRGENLEKCSGRGILLIESYMDKAKWTRHGRRLTMVKRNVQEPLPPR